MVPAVVLAESLGAPNIKSQNSSITERFIHFNAHKFPPNALWNFLPGRAIPNGSREGNQSMAPSSKGVRPARNKERLPNKPKRLKWEIKSVYTPSSTFPAAIIQRFLDLTMEPPNNAVGHLGQFIWVMMIEQLVTTAYL